MEEFTLSPEQVNNFLADGFLVIPNLLDTEETELLLAAAIADPMMKENVFDHYLLGAFQDTHNCLDQGENPEYFADHVRGFYHKHLGS